MSEPATGIDAFFSRYAEKNAGTVMAILAACSIIFPRAIPFFYFSLAIMAGIEIWRTGAAKHAFRAPTLIWILPGLFSIWCFVSVLWSQAPLQALSKVSFLALVIIAAWVISSWLPSISSKMSKHLKYGLLAGVLIGALLLLVEVSFGQPIKIAFLNLFDFARDNSSKHFKVINNEVTRLPLYFLNRNIATLNILYWPSIFLVVSQWHDRKLYLWLAALTLAVGIATFGSEHETSMFAFMVGGLIFGLTRLWPRIGVKLLALVWVLSILLVLPAAITSYNAKLYKADWLPVSARARIIIWSYTAHEYLKNPVIGVGALSTQVASDATRKYVKNPEGHVLPPQTARHGHNIFLQTWYELGAIGALLLMVAGLAMFGRINVLADHIKPYATAMFGGAIMLAAFTWGMWQVWYIAMFAFGLAALQIAVHERAADDIQGEP